MIQPEKHRRERPDALTRALRDDFVEDEHDRVNDLAWDDHARDDNGLFQEQDVNYRQGDIRKTS